MPHRRPPRLPAAAYVGFVRVFLTMCALERRTYFARADIVTPVKDRFLRTAARYDVEIIAYCFMPDHVHALAAGTSEAADVMKFATIFRERSGQTHRQRHERRLWQEGFFDQVLRDEDATFDVACYILANPVRAGLCDTVLAYPHSGSSRYALEDIVASVQWRPNSLG